MKTIQILQPIVALLMTTLVLAGCGPTPIPVDTAATVKAAVETTLTALSTATGTLSATPSPNSTPWPTPTSSPTTMPSPTYTLYPTPTPRAATSTSTPTPLATPTGTPVPTLTVEEQLEQLAQSLHKPWKDKEWELVIRLIEQILAINPDYDDMTEKLCAAHVNYGVQHVEQGNLEEAKEEFIRALDVKPDGGEAKAELKKLGVGPLDTGTFVKDSRRNGQGQLTVRNLYSLDTVFVLTTLDNAPVTAVYVRSNDSSPVQGIPDGTYYLFYILGEYWDSGLARFTRNSEYYRDEDTLTFVTTSTKFTTWEVTLNPPPDEETVPSLPVNADQFPNLR